MSGSDDEEAFFRKQKQKVKVSDIARSNRQEEDVPAPDAKKRGVFGRAVPTPGIGKLLKGKSGGTGKNSGKPPAIPGNQLKKGPSAQQSKKAADSDDDNLSISSDDEMESSRRAALQRQETRVIRGDAAVRAPPAVRGPTPPSGPEDEEDEASKEPELWDDVNEEELARKVRELRDPRGVATPPAALPPTPVLKKSSAGIEMSTELTDPLGLGPINMKSLSLASASAGPEDPSYVAANADKLLYFEDSFQARFYLARIHRETPVQELENGKLSLKRDIATHKEQLRKLVKDNFDIFINCKNTIDDIHVRLEQMESEEEGTGTERLSVSIRDCDEVARRAFSPLLERQAQVERIRSVQGLLQRFRTLFNLPSVIRAFVKKGEYDSAVHEYVKAKSLQLPVNSGILKKVLEEVEKVVLEFKEVLYSQMADPLAELSQVEYKIRLLSELEPEGDPIWHFLQLQERRIRGLLEGAQQEAERELEKLQQSVKEKQAAEMRWKQIQFESSTPSDVDLSLLLGEEHLLEPDGGAAAGGGAGFAAGLLLADVASEEASDAIQARLIRRLTAVLRQHVPRFWKLALSVFAGRFASSTLSTQDSYNNNNNNNTAAAGSRTPVRSESASASGRFSKHSQEQVCVMVLASVGSYETKVQAAFSQLEHAGELRPYMRQAVSEIANACAALRQKDCAPTLAVSALQQLRVDATCRFVQRLCDISRRTAMELAEEEDWVPAPTVKRDNAPYAISLFPLKFRDALSASLDNIAEVFSQLASEETSLEAVHAALASMKDSVKSMFFDSFIDFSESVERMAHNLSLQQQAEAAGDGEGGEGDRGGDSLEEDLSHTSAAAAAATAAAMAGSGEYSGLQAGVEVRSTDQRILMLLSNASFCRTVLLPQLADKYHHLWEDDSVESGRRIGSAADELERWLADLDAQFVNLERMLGDKYIEIKAVHLGMAVIKYFLEDGTSWATAPPVKGLRDSALELMHPLVAVHAEVYAGCRPFVEKAINMLAEGLMDALNQVALQHRDLEQLDVNAFCQLSLELDYFETVLQPFASQSLEDIVDQLREVLCQRTLDRLDVFQSDADADRGPRRLSRTMGLDDTGGDPPMPQSAQELRQLADSLSADLLPGELRRTKVNVYCFMGRQSTMDSNPAPSVHDNLSVPPSPMYRHPSANMQPVLTRTYSNSSSGSSSMQTRLPQAGISGRTASGQYGGSSSRNAPAGSITARKRAQSFALEPQTFPAPLPGYASDDGQNSVRSYASNQSGPPRGVGLPPGGRSNRIG